MLEILAYPVSALMKLWHLLLHNVLGIDGSTAWVISIFCLIITVRGLLAPIMWAQKRSAQVALVMRPEQTILRQYMQQAKTKEEVWSIQDAQDDLRNHYRYSPWAGCIPALIQLPILLGLYRVLYWLGLPEGRQHGDGTVGVLNHLDVAQFRESTVFDVPVVAYYAMSDEQFANLGTTAEHAQSLIFPILVAAIIFTMTNLGITLSISWYTMNWAQSFSVKMTKVMTTFCALIPLLLLSIGLNSPIALALIMYWAVGNLWSLSQTIVLNKIAWTKYPENDVHRAFRKQAHQNYVQQKKAKKLAKRRKRKAKLSFGNKGRELRQELQEEKDKRTALISEHKEKFADIQALRKEATKERKEALKQLKKEGRDKGGKHRMDLENMTPAQRLGIPTNKD